MLRRVLILFVLVWVGRWAAVEAASHLARIRARRASPGQDAGAAQERATSR